MGIARSLTLTVAKRGLRLLYLSQTAYYQHKFRRCVRERYVYHGYGPYGIKVSAEIWPSVHRDTPLSSPSIYMSAANDLYASDGLSDDDLSDGWDNPRTALWPQAVKLLQVNQAEPCGIILRRPPPVPAPSRSGYLFWEQKNSKTKRPIYFRPSEPNESQYKLSIKFHEE